MSLAQIAHLIWLIQKSFETKILNDWVLNSIPFQTRQTFYFGRRWNVIWTSRLSNVHVSREKPGPGFELNVRLQESTPPPPPHPPLPSHIHTQSAQWPSADQPLSGSQQVSPCQSQTVSWPQNRDMTSAGPPGCAPLWMGNNESDTFCLVAQQSIFLLPT